MKKLLEKIFLQKYRGNSVQRKEEAFALTSITIILALLTLVLSLILSDLQDKVLVLGMTVFLCFFLILIRAGFQRITGIVMVGFLTAACSAIVLASPLATYLDIYQLAFLNIFLLFLTLLITTEVIHALLVTGLGTAAILANFFFRAMPANLEGKKPDIDDLIVCLALLLLAGLLVSRSNIRGRRMMENIQRESRVNEKRAEQLKGVVGEVQANFDTGTRLLSSSSAMEEAVEELQSMLHDVRDEMNTLTASSIKLEIAGLSISDTSETVSSASESQSAVIQETSAAVVEMSSSIESISRIAEERQIGIRNLSDSAESAEIILMESTNASANLRELVQSMTEVNTVISAIAAQTGLLAMNAAIEAAHAGDAGRGFAVVADEVRKLSDSAGMNAKNITNILKELTTSIEKAASSNTTVADAFHSIRSEIQQVVQGMDEILSGISELAGGTSQINTGTSHSIEASSNLKSGIGEVNSRIGEITGSIENQKSGSQKILGSVEAALNKIRLLKDESFQVREIGEKNAENLKKLEEKLLES